MNRGRASRNLLLTSEWRLHGGLDEPCEQLRGLGLHGEAGGEGAERLGVPRQALQRHALTVVGLQAKGTEGQW